VGTALRRLYPADLVAAAVAQHELRLRAQTKFSRAMQMFFTRAGLEQASAEIVGRHHARRYAGAGRIADLCCGIGGDLTALAAGRQVLAIDRDPVHVRMAVANAEVYGVADGVLTVTSDVQDADLASVDGVFVDPARRAGGRRLRTGESTPSLAWCLSLAQQVAAVGIKAAPGIAHDTVPEGWELEFVAIGRDLKEAAVWSPALATAATRATILPARPPAPSSTAAIPATIGPGVIQDLDSAGGYTLIPRPGAPVPVQAPGAFLLDPSPAVTRAGLVEELARLLGAWKIDERIAFLSADQVMDTPFGRTLRVIDSAPWNQKQLAARLRALDIGSADIRRRGLAGDVDRVHAGLKLSGSRPATIVMTRVHDRPWALVCVDINTPGPA
jgi:hypothetical protein